MVLLSHVFTLFHLETSVAWMTWAGQCLSCPWLWLPNTRRVTLTARLTHTHTHSHTHTLTQIHAWIHTLACTYAHMETHTHTHTMCIFPYLHACTHVLAGAHTHTHTHTHTADDYVLDNLWEIILRTGHCAEDGILVTLFAYSHLLIWTHLQFYALLNNFIIKIRNIHLSVMWHIIAWFVFECRFDWRYIAAWTVTLFLSLSLSHTHTHLKSTKACPCPYSHTYITTH